MAHPVIALIFDCDGTLTSDTITFMLENHDIDAKKFWDEIASKVKDGWDPPQAYMYRILKYVQDGQIADLTQKKLRNLGTKVDLFPGLPDMFDELKDYVSENPDLKKAHVCLEYYIITGGLEEMIRGTPLAKHMHGIFGCNFCHDPTSGIPFAVKSTISFTEKTRFIFPINKDISPEDARRNPYLVNDAIVPSKRRVAFENMIYVGDGPSDIPCLSLVKRMGGEGIGVSRTGFARGYEMARGQRTRIGPYKADYRMGGDLRNMLETIIRKKGGDIALEAEKERITAPTH